MDKWRDRQRYREMKKWVNRETDRQAGREIEKFSNGVKGRQDIWRNEEANRERERHCKIIHLDR
jgi:hypothetical protein